MSRIRRRPGRGLALSIVLIVIPVLLVLTVGIGSVALAELNSVSHINRAKQATLAAEAGVSRTIAELHHNNRLQPEAPEIALFRNEKIATHRVTYTVFLTNNFFGQEDLLSPDGTTVPPGRSYVRSVGQAARGKRRTSKVMLTVGQPFPYALAAGGEIQFAVLNGSLIEGSIKCDSDLELGSGLAGAMVLTGLPGLGGLLQGESLFRPGGNVYVGGRLKNRRGTLLLGALFSPTQEVRARQGISFQALVRGASMVDDRDESDHTEPFIRDERETNLPTSGREILPRPDRSMLLGDERLVTHPRQSHYGLLSTLTGSSLHLGDQIHYFPDGVHFHPGSAITGRGTIVVGEGARAVFDIPLNGLDLNVVGLGEGSRPGREPQITFNGVARLQGLIYAHGSIRSTAAVTLKGRMVSYSGDLRFDGVSIVKAQEHEILIPGFDNFFAQKINKSVGVVSWQSS